MIDVHFSQKPLIQTNGFKYIEDSQMAFFDEKLAGIQTRVSPCILFVAYYRGKPVGAFHWSNFIDDNKTPVREYMRQLQIDISRFKMNISKFLGYYDGEYSKSDSDTLNATQKNKAIPKDILETIDDGTEPYDLLPIGGQPDSAVVVQAILMLAQKPKHRIMTTAFLDITIDNDVAEISISKDGSVYIQHISSKPLRQINPQIQEEDSIEKPQKESEYEIVEQALIDKVGAYFLHRLSNPAHFADMPTINPINAKIPKPRQA